MVEKINKTEEEWREELTSEQYRVLRTKGTERAFTGKYWDEKSPGVYVCAGCGLPLYDAETKFNSGTGWPSFHTPVDDSHIAEDVDDTLGVRRVEIMCAGCGGHLGHVFEDGPKPSGRRHCVNSISLELKPKADA